MLVTSGNKMIRSFYQHAKNREFTFKLTDVLKLLVFGHGNDMGRPSSSKP